MHVQVINNYLEIKPFLHAEKGCIMVSLNNYSREKVAKMPLIELAKIIMLQEKKVMKFSEAFNKVADLKGLTEEERGAKISQFYTDLNADGSFVSNGSNTWGLKRWYREEQKEKEVAQSTIKLKRKKRRASDDEFDEEFEMIDINIDNVDVDYEDDDDLEFEFDEEFDDEFEDKEDEYNDK